MNKNVESLRVNNEAKTCWKVFSVVPDGNVLTLQLPHWREMTFYYCLKLNEEKHSKGLVVDKVVS